MAGLPLVCSASSVLQTAGHYTTEVLLMYRVYTLISRYILHGVQEMNILKKPLDCCGYTCMSNKQILGLLLESMYMSIKRLSKNVFKV